ncbi:MAG: hypothetical protein LUO89_11290 [Methanothrix sp.]|nr:hypothetical protein [Methanothrix sp.]
MGLPINVSVRPETVLLFFIQGGYIEKHGQPGPGVFTIKVYGEDEVTLPAEEVELYLAKILRIRSSEAAPAKDPEALLQEPAPEQPSPDERYSDGQFKYRDNP